MKLSTRYLLLWLAASPMTMAATYEVEPNNQMATANPIAKSKTITAQLYSAEDQDWFKYTVGYGAKKSITAHLVCDFPKAVATTPLYTIGFYNSAGALQSSYAITNKQCSRKNFRLTMYTPTAGSYYLSISPPSANKSVNTNYRLRIGNSIAVGGSGGACSSKGGLVQWPLDVSPFVMETNQYFYCGYEIIATCHPWVWGCRDDGPPSNNYEGPPSGH